MQKAVFVQRFQKSMQKAVFVHADRVACISRRWSRAAASIRSVWGADLLKPQFETMTETIPAVATEVDRAVSVRFPGAGEVGEPMKRDMKRDMKREIAKNCRRALRNLG